MKAVNPDDRINILYKKHVSLRNKVAKCVSKEDAVKMGIVIREEINAVDDKVNGLLDNSGRTEAKIDELIGDSAKINNKLNHVLTQLGAIEEKQNEVSIKDCLLGIFVLGVINLIAVVLYG